MFFLGLDAYRSIFLQSRALEFTAYMLDSVTEVFLVSLKMSVRSFLTSRDGSFWILNLNKMTLLRVYLMKYIGTAIRGFPNEICETTIFKKHLNILQARVLVKNFTTVLFYRKMMKIFFLVFAMSLTLKNMVDACNCFPSHPQQLFCNADFGKMFLFYRVI